MVVVLLLCAKCFVFDSLIAQPASIQWELTDYLATIAAAGLIALPVLLTTRRWPAFAILAITDIWLIVNIIYFRSYRLFITWHLLSLAGNMGGFGSSIWPYCTWSLLWIPALTIPALICFVWESKRIHAAEIISVIVLSVVLSIWGSYERWNKVKAYLPDDHFSWEWINPCNLPQALSVHVSEKERQATKYIHHHSILAYPLFMAGDAIRTAKQQGEVEPLTAEEEQELKKLIGPEVPAAAPQGNLLIILLESFESWLLDVYDAHNVPVCPALKNYVETHPVLYVKDVSTQIRYGMSGDGQMIVNTGLYPTLEGVACVDYGHHTYPNLAHFYPQSAIINPCRNVWNKAVIASSYGYKGLVEPQSENQFEWNDSVVTDKTIETLNSLASPSCVLSLTVSGHLPFNHAYDAIDFPDSVPELFRNYMQSAHYTDRHMGRLLAWADTAQVMKNSVIVITGDHRIFHAWGSEEIRAYGLRANLPFGTGQAGCPLIIAAPQFDSTMVLEKGQQVDIFSTVLPIIGQEDYFWKGMGHDLMKEHSSDETEYFLRQQLSDKLIRMNYFEK